MSAHPSYPLLIVDPKGWLGLHSDGQKRRFSLSGALNTKKWTGYDSAGGQWQVAAGSFPYPDAWWTRLLANTVYNPRFEAELNWKASGGYSFNDLQRLICTMVDKDDDLLTQSIEADRLKSIVQGCRTFEDLVCRLESAKVVSR